QARRLLELTRGHWGIENRLHYVRDVTLGEDGCRVRKGSGKQPPNPCSARTASFAR
ncbi:MAG: transposase, partial [Planctomycetota bacterium]